MMHLRASALTDPAIGAVPSTAIKGAQISIEQLARHYGSIVAVNAVDLKVKAGEFLSLLGPSGSGKTTLLMMLAGFEMPTSGRIKLNDRDLTRVPPNKRDIGMVFQRYALFPHMTVAANIAFPLKMRGIVREDSALRVERALDLVRLQAFAHRMPSQLSGGQQQRVAVARALVFEPPVLLMDEPLGALDKKLREELQIEIKKLHRDLGVTIIYVTHDQDEALTMSDRIAVMKNGVIEQLGTPSDLYHAPKSSFVADFIGTMNFIEAVVVGEDDATVQVSLANTSIMLPRCRFADTTKLDIGLPVRIAVRPEALALQHGPLSINPSALRLLGTIDTSIFSGAHNVLIVRLDDGQFVRVHAAANRHLEGVERGRPVTFIIDPTSVLIFPATA